MFDVTTMHTCMKTLLGFRNSENPDVPQISGDLLDSDSGLYYNDFNPFVNMEMIVNAIDESADLETYLENKVNSGIAKMMTKLVLLKKEKMTTKTLLNSSRMFDGGGFSNNLVLGEGKFVGMEIKLKESYGLKVIIDRIGFQFSSPQVTPGFNLYIFHTSQMEPIDTIPIITAKSNSFEWVDIDPIDFSYLSEEYDSGGMFYLGYFQNDIVGQAINKEINWTKGPCQACDSGNAMKIWNQRLDFVRVTPIYVAQGNLNANNLFNYQDVVYNPTNNYGINFATTVNCDLSQYFCDNKILFADALGKQVAADILWDIKNSVRNNAMVSKATNMIIRDLEGDRETFEPGLAKRLEQALAAVDFDFSKIDSPCLPDSKQYGIRKGTA